MAREEVIQELRWIKEGTILSHEARNALDIAITALKSKYICEEIAFMCNLSGGADYFHAFKVLSEKVKNGFIEAETAEKQNDRTTDDCIRRADVEQTVEDNILCYTHSDRPIDQDPDTECHIAIRTALRMLRKDLRKLPSVQPDLQPTCNQLATDCINRQAAINTVVFECGEWTGLAKEISKQLRQMPSAQPEPERTMEEFMYGQDMGNPEDGSL